MEENSNLVKQVSWTSDNIS